MKFFDQLNDNEQHRKELREGTAMQTKEIKTYTNVRQCTCGYMYNNSKDYQEHKLKHRKEVNK